MENSEVRWVRLRLENTALLVLLQCLIFVGQNNKDPPVLGGGAASRTEAALNNICELLPDDPTITVKIQNSPFFLKTVEEVENEVMTWDPSKKARERATSHAISASGAQCLVKIFAAVTAKLRWNYWEEVLI